MFQFIEKLYRLCDDGDVIFVLRPNEPRVTLGVVVAVSNSLDGIEAAHEEYLRRL